jgi:hypothetical protein
MNAPELNIVHCVDTEGPLYEPLEATFGRIRSIFGLELEATLEMLGRLQREEIDLGGAQHEVAEVVRRDLLAYNEDWDAIRRMLAEAMGKAFRSADQDDFGGGWVYNWHVMDHVGYESNPRRKALGYGQVFDFYRNMLLEHGGGQDEINWHFHPVFPDGDPLKAATSYTNCYPTLNQVLCRRLLNHGWFPVANRPGFHSERPDSHAFLEQWLPFDFANQSYEEESGQRDLMGGRFGDWRRAPRSWTGYRPSHRDYQRPGDMNRVIFRCLNVGTRFRELGELHVRQAFADARSTGSAILAFADHDYRDIRMDVKRVRDLLALVRVDYPEVSIRYSGAASAARRHLTATGQLPVRQPLVLSVLLEANLLHVRCNSGQCFGPQPYLAYKTRDGRYFHDNLDVQVPEKHWTYVFDAQTILLTDVECVGVGSAGADGSSEVQRLNL